MTSKLSHKWIFLCIVLLIFALASFRFDDPVNEFVSNHRSLYLAIFFSLITNIGIVIMAMVAVPSIIIFKKNKKLMILLILALVISTIVSMVLKILFLRERPSLDINYETFYILNYSFPSMHSMIVFSLLPILNKHFKRQKNFWILCAFTVAISRIYLGFHFLSDVLFGGIFGYIFGKIITIIGEKYGPKKV